MPRGRRCRTLSSSQIARLEHFRREGDVEHPNGFTYPQLKLSMNGSFKLDVLMRGMGGKPIWERYYAYIAEWVDRYIPERPIVGGEASISVEQSQGDDFQNEFDEKTAAPARTIRGSR